MNNLFKLYSDLLNIYTEQVKKLELLKSEAEKTKRVELVPHMALNHRMFTYDEYLQNPSYGGFCYIEKNIIMPYLVPFFVAFDNSSEEIKIEFEQLKPKNQYQKYLDELLGKIKIPFIEFLKLQLHELQEIQYRYDIPSRPTRSNATRQQAEYEKNRKKYFEKVESLNRCREEINERIKLVNELRAKLE